MTVLIAGAGPTGLTLACFLRAQGVAVRVVDAADAPATTSRALGLHRRGTEVLRRAGALGDLRERSIVLRSATLLANRRPMSELPLGGEFGPLLISQAAIEGQLRDRLAELGTTIDWSTALTGLDQDRNGVTVTLGDGSAERFDWVVGCDGAHSAVRRLTGISFPGNAIIERFLLADLHLRWDDADRAGTRAWLHAEGMLAVFPLPCGPSDDLWRVVADVPAGADEDGEPTERQIIDGLRDAMLTRAGIRPEIVKPAWTSRFRIHRRLADTFRSGRVLLAGDAAHIHSPFGGQGMNTGIGDAENLAWKLALVVRGRADAALLDSYEAERRPIAKGVLASTTTVTKLALSGNPLVRAAREQLLPALLRVPKVRKAGVASASQLSVSYRKGPLGARGPHRRPAPGDRVPDIWCTDRAGERVRLHDRLGTRWIVLARSHAHAAKFVTALGKRLDPASVDSLVPANGTLSGVYVVRPDGHLAWRDGEAPERLTEWLEAALSTGRAR